MSKVVESANHKMSLIKDVATKRIVKQFASKHNFIYFGRVDPHDDEHTLVRAGQLYQNI